MEQTITPAVYIEELRSENARPPDMTTKQEPDDFFLHARFYGILAGEAQKSVLVASAMAKVLQERHPEQAEKLHRVYAEGMQVALGEHAMLDGVGCKTQ